MNELRGRIVGEVRKVVVGQEYSIDVLIAAASIGGHVLLEGVPGTAKTLLANAFARALGLEFRRVQFTPDMLPSDLTGTMTLRADGQMAFRPGPVFTNVLLADEINRTPPKTQAALLEAMQEGQVSVDGVSRPLPKPFIVIATQNPIEYEGTYPLPEAQLDRFFAKLDIGYPSSDDEFRIATMAHRGLVPATLDDVQRVTTAEDLLQAREVIDATKIADDVVRYAVAVVRQTRDQPSVLLGASPRAAIHLIAASKTAARLAGRDFVTPDDVRSVAPAVLSHRLVMRPESEMERFGPTDALRNVLSAVPVPR